jgi:hypothetical protein
VSEWTLRALSRACGKIICQEVFSVLVVKTNGAGMSSPIPSDLKEVRDALWQDVVFVHTKWNIFKELHSTKENVDLLNFGGDEYFGIDQMIWAENIQMAIARLTDPHQTGSHKNLSMEQLLLHIDSATPPGLYAQVKAAVEELEALCEPIRARRMKLLAHSDLDVRLGRNAATLDPITSKVIDSCLEKMRDIMNAVELAHLGSTTMFDTNLESPAGELLYHLKEAREYQRQERVRLGLPADPESQPEV